MANESGSDIEINLAHHQSIVLLSSILMLVFEDVVDCLSEIFTAFR